METEKRVHAEERILMRDFPLRPGDWVVMRLECCGNDYPCLGEVIAVGSRNPDPGVAIELKTPEEFEAHIGGAHGGVRLSRLDSMWAEIKFIKPHCEDAVVKKFFTYDLVEKMGKNKISFVPPEDRFINMENFLRYVKEKKADYD